MEINQERHENRIKIASIVATFLGIILLILSYKFSTSTTNLLSFLSLNIGGLFIVGGAYSLISELYLKKNFSEQIQISIKEKIKQFENYENLKSIGFSSIEKTFSSGILIEKIKNSKKVGVFSLINHNFFSTYATELKELIETEDLKIEIFLFNYESDALDAVKNRFAINKSDDLKENIKTVLYDHINHKIISQLTDDKKDNIKVYLYDRHPTYSAYVFDDNEYWFVPIFYQKDRQLVPIFIFKEHSKIIVSEFYKDYVAIKNESKKMDFI